jgi:hypothetical protein
MSLQISVESATRSIWNCSSSTTCEGNESIIYKRQEGVSNNIDEHVKNRISGGFAKRLKSRFVGRGSEPKRANGKSIKVFRANLHISSRGMWRIGVLRSDEE